MLMCSLRLASFWYAVVSGPRNASRTSLSSAQVGSRSRRATLQCNHSSMAPVSGCGWCSAEMMTLIGSMACTKARPSTQIVASRQQPGITRGAAPSSSKSVPLVSARNGSDTAISELLRPHGFEIASEKLPEHAIRDLLGQHLQDNPSL